MFAFGHGVAPNHHHLDSLFIPQLRSQQGCVAVTAGWLYEIINWVVDFVLDAIGVNRLLQRAQDALLGPLRLDLFNGLSAKIDALTSIDIFPDVSAAARQIVSKVPVGDVRMVSISCTAP
jgi:hypothetical protein